MKKNKIKRFLSFMLAVILVLTMTNLQVFATDEGKDGPIEVSDTQEGKDDAAEVSDTEEGNDDAAEVPAIEDKGTNKNQASVLQDPPEGGIIVTDAIGKRTVYPDRPGNANTEKIQKQFVHTPSEFQPTGLMYYPTEDLTVTVTGDPSDPTPSIAFSQGWYHSVWAEETTKIMKLKYGVNKIKAPNYHIAGAIYIINPYTEAEQKTAPTITIEGEELEEYPIYYSVTDRSGTPAKYMDQNGKMQSFGDFEHFKKVLVNFKENKVDRHNGDDMYSIAYPELADFFSDSFMITTTTTGAYASVITGKDHNGKALDNGGKIYTEDDVKAVLKAYDEALFDQYDYAGLKQDSIDPRHSYPKSRMHMRIMNDGLCHRASRNNFFMDAGEGETLQYTLIRKKQVDEWGLLHEMGHMIENSSIRYLETTNNLYVMDRQIMLNDYNRLKAENRWDSLFSKFSSQLKLEFKHPKYGVDLSKKELTNWDRLVMLDQLNLYFRKQYPKAFPKGTDTMNGWDYFTAVTSAVREESLVGPQFYDPINVMTYLTAKGITGADGSRVRLDIKPFLKISTMEDVYLKFDWYNDLYEITYPTCDESIPEYAHYIDETYEDYKGAGLDYKVRGQISKVESAGMSNKLSITMTNGGSNADLLGYEVYRDGERIGYAKANKTAGAVTSFTDVMTNVNANYVYSVLPVDKNLKPAGKSDGYSYKNTNAFVQGQIKIEKIEYNSMTNELVVRGDGYTKRENYRMVLHVDTKTNEAGKQEGGYSYFNKDEKKNGSERELNSYTSFFDLGFGNWEMHVTNFQAASKESFSLMPELQLRYMLDETHEVIDSIRVGDRGEYAFGGISVEDSESALLKSIKVSGLGQDENAANDGSMDQTVHFDPLVKNYDYKKWSDTTKDILVQPQAKITFLPVAADASATYSVKVYDVTDGTDTLLDSAKGKAEISFERAANKKYRIDVEVKSNYGEAGCKVENYQFKIDCPSENAYLSTLQFQADQVPGQEAATLTLKDSAISSKPSDTIKRAEQWTDTEIMLNATGTVKDDNLKIVNLAPTACDSKAVIAYALRGSSGAESKPADWQKDFTPLKLNAGSCEFSITAPDGVTTKVYHLTGTLSDAEKARAELRPNVAEWDSIKLAQAVDTKTDKKIYFSATVTPERATTNKRNPAITPSVLYSGMDGATGKWTVTGLAADEYKFNELDTYGNFTQLEFLKSSALDKLEKGQASLTYTVTAPDKKTTKTYEFCYKVSDGPDVTDIQNVNLYQKGVSNLLYPYDVTEITEPGSRPKDVFKAGIFDYIFITKNSEKICFVAPALYIGSSKLFADGVEIKLDGNSYKMSPATKEFKWVVTAASGKEYTYTFRKFRSTDTKVSKLTLTAGTLYDTDGKASEFSPESKDYTIKVTNLSEIKFNELSTAAADASVSIFLDGVLQEKLVSAANPVKARSATKALKAAARNAADTNQTSSIEIQVQAANGNTDTYNFQVEMAEKKLSVTALEAAINRAKTGYLTADGVKDYTSESYKNLEDVVTKADDGAEALLAKAKTQNNAASADTSGLILQTEIDTMVVKVQQATTDLIKKTDVITPKTVQISATKASLEKGKEMNLTARVNYNDGSFASTGFIWSSSSSDLVSVTSDGKITAVAVTAEPVTITATPDAAKYPGMTLVTCQVTVLEEALNPIEFAKGKVTLKVNENSTLTFAPGKIPTDGKNIDYTSSNSDVVTVDGSGQVTGKVPGTVTISAAYADAPNISDSCVVTVSAPEYILTINPTGEVTNMQPGATVTLTAGATEKGTALENTPVITWTSSNTAVAEVDENTGVVTAKASGDAIIYANTKYAKEQASITVTVAKTDYTVSIEGEPTKALYIGQTHQLNASVKSGTASQARALTEVLPIVYGSSNTKVVTVDNNGLIKAVGAGTAEVTAAYARDTAAFAKLSVTVKGISLENTGDIYLLADESAAFGATAEPEETISYGTGDAAVATIGTDGQITAQGPGVTTVTAMVDGDNTSKKERTVHVYTLTVPENLSLTKGDTTQADAISVLPADVDGTVTKLMVGTKGDITSVVMVNADNTLTATGGGTAEVTVQIAGAVRPDGTTCSKTFTVNVTELTMDTTAVTLGVNGTTIRAAALQNGSGETVSYTSSDTAVATVSQDGTITGVKEGKADITASVTVNGKALTKTLNVQVWDIKLTPDVSTMNVRLGDNTKKIVAEAGAELQYSTKDTQILGVNETTGELTPAAVGEAKVTVSVRNTNVTKDITVKVYDLMVTPESALTSGTAQYLIPGETLQITASDGIGEASGATYTYTTTSKCVDVDKTGLVTAKEYTESYTSGKSQITVNMVIGEDIVLSKTVYVNVYWLAPLTAQKTVGIGNRISLEGSVAGARPTNVLRSWTVSSTDVGNVKEQDGSSLYFYGYKAGKVKVTVALGELTRETEITVFEWKMSNDTITLVPGASYNWVSTFLPADADIKLKPTYSVKSGSPDVAVDSNGKITVSESASAGIATIQASMKDDVSMTTVETRELKINIAPISFEAGGGTTDQAIQEKLTDMKPNGEPVTLTTTLVLPEGVTAPVLTYVSTNPSVATATAKEQTRAARTTTKTYMADIQAVGAGSTDIQVKLGETVLKTFAVTVKSLDNTAEITSVEAPNNKASVEVEANVIRTDKYRMELSWGALEYTYDFGTWDPDTHSWSKTDENWTAASGADKITLTNHSSMPVKVAMEALMKKGSADDAATDTDITAVFKDGTENVPAAGFGLKAWTEGKTLDEVKGDVQKEIQLTFTGKPNTKEDAKVRKGAATITIEEDTATVTE